MLNLSIFVNIILYFLLPEVTSSAEAKRRYIIMLPKKHPQRRFDDTNTDTDTDTDQELFSDDLAADFSEHEILMNTEKRRFISISLTEKAARKLKKKLGDSDSLVVPDELVSIPNIPFVIRDDNTTSADTEFLTNTPKCHVEVNNVDFVVLDTLVFSNAPDLQGVKINFGPNYTPDKSPCHPHGTWVSSIIAGSQYGVIPSGKRTIYNIVVFNCNAQGFPSYIIQAFNHAMQLAKENAIVGRRTLINLSGGGGLNPAMDAAANAIVDAGIALFVSAGNDAIDACTSASPAAATKVIAVGATTPPGNVPAYFTNWGDVGGCVRFYLPGTGIQVLDVSNPNIVLGVSGTSFASPIGAALGGIELQRDLQATPAEILARLSSRMITVSPPPGGSFNQLMPVLLSLNACANNLELFSAFVTTKADSNKFLRWYDGVRQTNMCVSFKAASNINSLLVGIRGNSNATSEIVSIKIGVKANTNYVNSISQNGINLAFKRTSTRILNKQVGKTYKVSTVGQSILFSYTTMKGDEVSFLSANVVNPPAFKEISFSGSGPGVKYLNAMKC